MQLLTAYYFDKGFLDVKISEPKIDLSDPKRIRIEIEISEGPQYRFGNIDLKGDVLTTKEDLFKVGQDQEERDLQQLCPPKGCGRSHRSVCQTRAMPYVEVSPETSVDRQNLSST